MVRAVCVVVVCFLAMVGVARCRSDPPPTVPLRPALTETPSLAERSSLAELTDGSGGLGSAVGCGGSVAVADVVDADARFEVIGEVIAALREGSCEPVDEARRLCRALFLVGATDPLAGLGAGLDIGQIERLVDWHGWALADGIAAADLSGDGAAADALRALARIDVGDRRLSVLAEAAVERANRSIIEPLAEVEARCLSQPLSPPP